MGDRVAVWIVAELHLMFAAFVLGVPVREIVKDGDGEERSSGSGVGAADHQQTSHCRASAASRNDATDRTQGADEARQRGGTISSIVLLIVLESEHHPFTPRADTLLST